MPQCLHQANQVRRRDCYRKRAHGQKPIVLSSERQSRNRFDDQNPRTHVLTAHVTHIYLHTSPCPHHRDTPVPISIHISRTFGIKTSGLVFRTPSSLRPRGANRLRPCYDVGLATSTVCSTTSIKKLVLMFENDARSCKLPHDAHHLSASSSASYPKIVTKVCQAHN